MDFKSKIEELSIDSKTLVNSLKKKNSYHGFMRLLTDLYPDNAHFIYELLQNAEDAEASHVTFNLYNHELIFIHNGKKLFTYENIESITAIGDSTKRDDPTSIGKFGVGFKAVFAYTTTPEVHSGKIKFKITELIVPHLIDYDEQNTTTETTFIFPFNNPQKSEDSAFLEVTKGLNELTSTSLLFLKNINAIQINIKGKLTKTIERTNVKTNLINIKLNEKNAGWLLFQKTISIQEKNLRVAIAFGYDTEKKQIIPVDGKVSIYFPCEKETSNLKFHIHAPFASTVARDSVRNTHENEKLKTVIAELAAESLIFIKEEGLLKMDFFKVLPNSSDALGGFQIIAKKIKAKFKNDDLVPMHSGGFASANGIFIGNNEVKKLFNDEDLAKLLTTDEEGFSSPMWVKGYANETRVDGFLNDLGIQNWGVREFLNTARQYDCSSFYETKDTSWFRRLYALLNKSNYIDYDNYPYDNQFAPDKLDFVKLKNNEGYAIGEGCYFATDDVENIEDISFVDEDVYITNSTEKRDLEDAKEAREFLEKLGVKEVDEKERIKIILESRYKNKNLNNKIEEIISFINFFKKYGSTIDFTDYYIFKKNDNSWGKGHQIYIDNVYQETGLNEFYIALENKASRFPLNEAYKKLEGLNKTDFIRFLLACGAIDKLNIKQISCRGRFRSYERIGDETDYDFTIEGLSSVILNPNEIVSKLIWKTLNSADESPYHNHLKAYYKANRNVAPKIGYSRLVELLKTNKWIPQIEDGYTVFKLPKDTCFENLPEDFEIIRIKEWLKSVDFGKALEHQQLEQAKTEADKKKEDSYVKEVIGFENREEAREYAELKKELTKSGLSITDIKDKLLPKRQIQPEFPQQIINNPIRVQQKTIENVKNANEITYKNITKRERITANTINPKEFLKETYTNAAHKMVCQLCHDEMPFKTKASKYYFEAVEIVKAELLKKELEAHYLALCPVCAARYKEYLKTDDEKMKMLIKQILKPNNEEITVQLDKNFILKFSDRHRLQLRVSLGNQ